MDSVSYEEVIVGLGVLVVGILLVWLMHKIVGGTDVTGRHGVESKVWWIESRCAVFVFAFFLLFEARVIYLDIYEHSDSEDPYAAPIILLLFLIVSVLLVVGSMVLHRKSGR